MRGAPGIWRYFFLHKNVIILGTNISIQRDELCCTVLPDQACQYQDGQGNNDWMKSSHKYLDENKEIWMYNEHTSTTNTLFSLGMRMYCVTTTPNYTILKPAC